MKSLSFSGKCLLSAIILFISLFDANCHCQEKTSIGSEEGEQEQKKTFREALLEQWAPQVFLANEIQIGGQAFYDGRSSDGFWKDVVSSKPNQSKAAGASEFEICNWLKASHDDHKAYTNSKVFSRPTVFIADWTSNSNQSNTFDEISIMYLVNGYRTLSSYLEDDSRFGIDCNSKISLDARAVVFKQRYHNQNDLNTDLNKKAIPEVTIRVIWEDFDEKGSTVGMRTDSNRFVFKSNKWSPISR